MDDYRALLEALEVLDPSKLTYSEWVDVGMALKSEGLPCSVWDDWSKRDTARYKPTGVNSCQGKWKTFNGEGKNGGTIVFYAEKYHGYSPSHAMDWDDGLEATYEDTIAIHNKPDEKPYQMAVRFLETLFEPDESVSFVTAAKWDEEKEKWKPASGGIVRKCSDIVKDLKKHRGLTDAFGTINEEAGAWIRLNPTTGPNNKDVTRFAYALAESDNLTIEEQKKLLIGFKLPIATLVESGGKSVHAAVKVDASDAAEYKQRTLFLFDWLAKHKFIVDENNKNEARLSRLPGAMRKGKVQKLIATNIGCASWDEWKDYIESIDDDLPPFRSLKEQAKDPPQLSPELIEGVLREGCKMIITGQSKAGKTCLSQNLAICIAEGRPWLGEFPCAQGKVLYINLEVEEASLYRRFMAMYKAFGTQMTAEGGANIIPWNLRGHAAPMDKLAPKIISRCRNTGPYKAIIIDPLYKVQQGDENSAEAICSFTNALDKIAHETGAAIIYDHHHPKGDARENVIDRGSGSGVFSRDADAICDISTLSPDKATLELIGHQMQEGDKPMQISFVLRDFKDIEPFNIWFRFPLHFIDESGLLKGAPIKGSKADNLNQSSKRTTTSDRKEQLDRLFKACEEDGVASISEMVEYANGDPSEASIRRYIKEFGDEYKTVRRGFICKGSGVS